MFWILQHNVSLLCRCAPRFKRFDPCESKLTTKAWSRSQVASFIEDNRIVRNCLSCLSWNRNCLSWKFEPVYWCDLSWIVHRQRTHPDSSKLSKVYHWNSRRFPLWTDPACGNMSYCSCLAYPSSECLQHILIMCYRYCLAYPSS